MKNIFIPSTVEEYRADIIERTLLDKTIAENDFYKNLAGWVIDRKTPILYEQEYDDEYANFSINFNWLLLRDYSKTKLGPPDTIASLYAVHEFTHMTHRLPTSLSNISAQEYAEDFTKSEYRASNESEILVHYRIPGIREFCFGGMKIAYDMLKEHGINVTDSYSLSLLRPILIETSLLDEYFSKNQDDATILSRLKQYGGNRSWAIARFNRIRSLFDATNLAQSIGLADGEYEATIAAYEPHIDQEEYEENIIRNVKFGYLMCGLAEPEFYSFGDALAAAKELEGHHARV